ncbi:MAG: hypothetical protein DHS20C14_21630 [Phycisphaeraceae bacterium]|nr:MAG: hypothetical protein DHS20C14_21630 [Phycisphaeraceae bacterium]
MRIIGGNLKRRKLESPPEGSTTRPMPDMVREAIFNLLRGHVEDQAVLDCFCGSGTMGLEAVSRGADRVVLVERDRRVVRALERNIEHLDVADRCDVVSGDALGMAAWSACPKPVHLIFFDPPYAMVRDPEEWERVKTAFARLVGLLDPEGYAVLRTPWPFVHGGDLVRVNEEGDDAEDASAVEGQNAGEEVARAQGIKTPAVDVDLAMPGALGPETHPYGTTAVHLYMRDPEAREKIS